MVGGTSESAPIFNGLEADTENFVAAQTYGGPTPSVGFEAPTIYTLGNGGSAGSFFHDVTCGNNAPSSGSGRSLCPAGWRLRSFRLGPGYRVWVCGLV